MSPRATDGPGSRRGTVPTCCRHGPARGNPRGDSSIPTPYLTGALVAPAPVVGSELVGKAEDGQKPGGSCWPQGARGRPEPQHGWRGGPAWPAALPAGVAGLRRSSPSAVGHPAARDYALPAAGVSPREMSPGRSGPAPNALRRNLKSPKSALKPRLWRVKRK